MRYCEQEDCYEYFDEGSEKKPKKYCSNKCRQKAYRSRKKIEQLVTCKHCGLEFYARRKTAKYCDSSCRKQAFKTRKVNALA